MAYDFQGEGALDYMPCRYGKSKLLFRGPRRKLQGSYVAALGGTETYGRFVERPYPALTEELIDLPVVNFGTVNAGIDVFVNDHTIINACSQAAVTVIQVSGAHNLSNRFYAVHPRRNDRFLRASNLLKTFYREVDFTEFNFTRHLLSALQKAGPENFALVTEELREAWVARMRLLVSTLDSKVVLLWLSDHTPDEPPPFSAEGSDPLFVDREMLLEVAPYTEATVEVVVTAEDIARGYDEMVFSDLDEPAARGMLGTVAHVKAAHALKPVLERLS